MTKKQLEELLAKISKQKEERSALTEGVEFDKLTTEELKELSAKKEEYSTKIKELEERAAIMQTLIKKNTDVSPNVFGGKEEFTQDEKEERDGKFYADLHNKAEQRSIVLKDVGLSSTHGTEINTDFNKVSTLAELVTVNDFTKLKNGKTTHKETLDKGSITMHSKKEGVAVTPSDLTLGTVTITQDMLEGVVRVSNSVLEVQRQSLNTETFINDKMNTSYLSTLNEKIMVGKADNGIGVIGIYNTPTEVITGDTDIGVSEINADTLTDIKTIYGNKNNEYYQGTLILSKSTLAKFTKLRTDTGTKVYEVNLNTNGLTGTIDGTPFILNHFAGDIDTAEVGEFFMAYGDLKHFMVVEFRDFETNSSKHVEFLEDNTIIKGNAYVGGAVTFYEGFTRVKKK